MSNSLAIATVTATLQRVLQQALNGAGAGAVDGAEVKAVRPGAQGTVALGKGVALYLYQVTPNVAGRNADLPTRSGDGGLRQRPRAALDLVYLLSFYGDEATLEPQRLLGIVASHMHAHPVLSPQAIRETLADAVFRPFLEGSDLAEQVERVRFTPVSFSLEEMSKLWSVFFQTTHALSLVYQASVVFIETDDVPVTPALVRERGIFVDTGTAPRILGLGPQILTRADRLTIHGHALRGDVTLVRFGGLAPVAPDSVAGDRIEVSLPAELPPGVNTVSVLHRKAVTGTAGARVAPIESNVAAFMLVEP